MKEEIKIIVCMKQVPDPEGPPSSFEIDEEKKEVIPKGIPPVLSPFDENALEAALKIKESHKAKITVISMGKKLARAVIKKALAVGGDELIKLEDELFNPNALDSFATAYILAAAIKKIGEYDIILAGRQAADGNAGQVGLGIAEILDIPSVALAQRIEIDKERVVVERILPDGFEVIKAPMPLLITVSHELGELRYASLPQIREAEKKPILQWNAQDIGGDFPPPDQTSLVSIFAPVRDRNCHLVEGETSEEAGANLALKLFEDKTI